MGAGIGTINQIHTPHPTGRLTMSLSLLVERQDARDLAEIGLLLRNGADLDQALTDLPKRTQSTALDAVQALARRSCCRARYHVRLPVESVPEKPLTSLSVDVGGVL